MHGNTRMGSRDLSVEDGEACDRSRLASAEYPRAQEEEEERGWGIC